MNVGVVIIGRNEGDRLRRCLDSALGSGAPIVYVDSGSTDGSIPMARSKGVEVLELDTSIPFSAARARNAGFDRLIKINPLVEYIQFIDGDCEIIDNWMQYATGFLSNKLEVAIIAGLLNERFPEASIYNRLGDIEWNFSGLGEVRSVGGIFLVRRKAFESVNGFNSSLTAGEEAELCNRLSKSGWLILRLDKKMALHDLAMTRFSQWWTRQVRNGYGSAYAGRYFNLANFKRNNLRVKIWAIWLLLIPYTGITVSLSTDILWGLLSALGIFAIWPAQVIRIAYRNAKQLKSLKLSYYYALFVMIAYFPQMAGQAKFFTDRFTNRSNRLIEYKKPGNS